MHVVGATVWTFFALPCGIMVPQVQVKGEIDFFLHIRTLAQTPVKKLVQNDWS
jgi:hypothetical protein